MAEMQIRSRDRVRDLAEVYTREQEVNAMLDLVPSCAADLGATFLEPSCGNGNFLSVILKRKLAVAADRAMDRGVSTLLDRDLFEFDIVVAVASIYGVDICESNVEDARCRMRCLISDRYDLVFTTRECGERFWEVVDYLLTRNLIAGDMLKATASLLVTQYHFTPSRRVSQQVFRMSDVIAANRGDLLARATPKRGPVRAWRNMAHG